MKFCQLVPRILRVQNTFWSKVYCWAVIIRSFYVFKVIEYLQVTTGESGEMSVKGYV
jgi:hypothetical protein